MNVSSGGAVLATVCIACSACAHGEDNAGIVTAEAASDVDPLGIGSSVTFERRDSNACPDTEGGEMWFAKLSGIVAVTVTYGVRFNGSDDGRQHTMTLDPRYNRERKMFCTGDGVNLDFKPFLIRVEPN